MRRSIVTAACGSALFLGLSTSAFAIEVSRSLAIKAPPGVVWSTIGDFCGIARWHPLVKGCVKSGESDLEGESTSFRNLTIGGDLGTLVEVQTSRDDLGMNYSYAYVEGPLPVKAYNATIAVRPDGDGSVVVWTATFDASGMSEADAKADIEDVYDQGLAGIAKAVGK